MKAGYTKLLTQQQGEQNMKDGVKRLDHNLIYKVHLKKE